MEKNKVYISANGIVLEEGQRVLMPEPLDALNDTHNHQFAGRVSGFQDEYITVEDGEGDHFSVEAERVVALDDNDEEIEPEFSKTNKLKVVDKTGKEIDLFNEVLTARKKKGLVVGFFGGLVYVQAADGTTTYEQGKKIEVRPTQKGKFFVWNETDGITAHYEKMTITEAAEFAKNFAKRFEAQGYYRNNRMEKMPAETVILLPKKKLF